MMSDQSAHTTCSDVHANYSLFCIVKCFCRQGPGDDLLCQFLLVLLFGFLGKALLLRVVIEDG